MINGGDGWAEEEKSHKIPLWELLPEFDLIFKLAKNVPFLLSQVCVVSVLKETLPEKKHLPHPPARNMG